MIHQKDKVKYGTRTISYHIVKSKRVKTSEIIVDGQEVTIRTPLDKNILEIKRIALDKANWILKKQKENRESKPQIIKPTFKQDSTLSYLGRNYPLKILNNQAKTSFEFVNGGFIIKILGVKSNTDNLTRLYERWLVDNTLPTLKNMIDRYSHELNVKLQKIAIKKLKNRWGSLTKDGKTMSVNINLFKTPNDVIEYVVLHELCHLKIKEHSHHYWDLVRKFMPNYEEKIKWLEINGSNLITI